MRGWIEDGRLSVLHRDAIDRTRAFPSHDHVVANLPFSASEAEIAALFEDCGKQVVWRLLVVWCVCLCVSVSLCLCVCVCDRCCSSCGCSLIRTTEKANPFQVFRETNESHSLSCFAAQGRAVPHTD